MATKIRTWTLRNHSLCPVDTYAHNYLNAGGSPLADDERVTVVEAEPVLDLLEQALPIIREWKHGKSITAMEVAALLKAHGRLSDSEALDA